MFSYTTGTVVIKNLGLIDTNIAVTTGSNSAGVADSAGGVVGNSYGTVKNCYSTADVIGRSSRTSAVGVGGVVGIRGSVQYCYATGSVLGSGPVGGILAYGASTATRCVALNSSIITTSGITTNNNSNLGRVFSIAPNNNMRNYGKSTTEGTNPMIMRYNTNTTYSVPPDNWVGHDKYNGETLSTVAGDVKNPYNPAFWTTDANWGGDGTAWDTTIWDTTTAPTLGRPILKGFKAGAQGEQ